MNDISEAESAKIAEWTRVAFDYAVADGFINPPWRPSEALYGALLELYLIGMTPSDAAQAIFATRH